MDRNILLVLIELLICTIVSHLLLSACQTKREGILCGSANWIACSAYFLIVIAAVLLTVYALYVWREEFVKFDPGGTLCQLVWGLWALVVGGWLVRLISNSSKSDAHETPREAGLA